MIDEGWNSHGIECMRVFSGAFVSRQVTRDIYGAFK